jgi:hypothetical protein
LNPAADSASAVQPDGECSPAPVVAIAEAGNKPAQGISRRNDASGEARTNGDRRTRGNARLVIKKSLTQAEFVTPHAGPVYYRA